MLKRRFKETLSNSLCGMKRKTHGVQEPRHIKKYVEVTSTAQRDDSPAQRINRRFLKWICLIALPIVLFFVSLAVGKYHIPLGDLIHTLCYNLIDPSRIKDPNMQAALLNIRLPRVLCVMIVGAGLSIAGAAYQGMFKNPIASPDILGASAGAGTGAALGMLMGMPSGFVQLFAFCGGLAAVLFTIAINRSISRDPILGLVLGGMMIGSLFLSATSYIKLMADADSRLPAITFWLMGGFSSINRFQLVSILLPMAISFFIIFAMRWKLNVFSFGEEEARTLGVNTVPVRRLVIFAATLITASGASVSGQVAWVGLIIPHLARAIMGPNFRALIPASALLGCSFLLVVDGIARNAWSMEMPIGILTASIGIPFFLLVYKSNAGK